eukprot:SAG25_NODE_1008_length_4323_cov_5.595206_3_plen_53_part_00
MHTVELQLYTDTLYSASLLRPCCVADCIVGRSRAHRRNDTQNLVAQERRPPQ